MPLATSPPVFVAEAGGVVHVLAMDAQNRGALHGALDRDGALVGSARAVPLSLLSAGACGDAVIATGVRDAKRRAIALDAAGAPRWDAALPIEPGGLVWIVPTCVAREPALVWEIERDGGAELRFAAVREGAIVPAPPAMLSGVAYRLDAAALGAHVFVLRGRGASAPGEIVRLDAGAVTARADTAPNAQAIAAVGERLAVLSWTQRALVLAWLDASLKPSGAPETIATIASPSWIRHATLHAAGDDRIAVSYLVGEADDRADSAGQRSEPGESARHFVGRYDPASRALADVTEVAPPGLAWNGAAWLGDRLLVVHGARGAALSVFALSR